MDRATAVYYVSVTVKPSASNLRFHPDIQKRLEPGLVELYAKLQIAEKPQFTVNENSIDLKIPVVDDGRIGVGVRVTDIIGEVTIMLDLLVDRGQNSDLFKQLIDRHPGLRERRGFSRVVACWDSLEHVIEEVLTKVTPLSPQEVRQIKKDQPITQPPFPSKVNSVDTSKLPTTSAEAVAAANAPPPPKQALVPDSIVQAAERAPLPPTGGATPIL